MVHAFLRRQVLAYNQQQWRTACKHCFMTCNTISLVSQLIWKSFRWKFIDIFEDVCSLHTCFSADSIYSIHLLCCITPCESSGRFFGPPGISPDFFCNFWCQNPRLGAIWVINRIQIWRMWCPLSILVSEWNRACCIEENFELFWRGVMERCLARRRNHCLDTDGGILAARTSSKSQCKSSGWL